MIKIRKCIVCDNNIKIKLKKIGTSGNRQYSRLESNNGVYYLKKWFCLICWNKIIQHNKIWNKKNDK